MKGYKIIIILTLTVFTILIVFFYTKNIKVPVSITKENIQINATISPIQKLEEWKTFTNKDYHYSIMYPVTVTSESPQSEQDGLPPEEAIGVNFGIYATPTNGTGRLSIEAKEFLTKYIFPNAEWPNAGSNTKSSKRMKELNALPLKKYVDLIYQYQIAEQTLNSPYSAYTIKVGPLTESTFANQRSYQFTLTGGYHDEFTSYGIGNEESMYIITEDPRGNKFVIHYTNYNLVAEKMLESFRFLDVATSTVNTKLQ